MKRGGFTLLEMIFVMGIIGILIAFAIPKFVRLGDNAKITADISTASSVQSALENCHGEWVINDDNFTCGSDLSRDDLNTSTGYPASEKLGSDSNHPLDRILKNAHNLSWRRDTDDSNKFYGSTYENIPPKNPDVAGKPDGNDYWIYSEKNGTFSLKDVS